MASRTREEGWKGTGILKAPGIPTPSGKYRVGCVDLMHQLEGDNGGLLVRLHYPTEATPGAGFPYAPWFPHRAYIKGYLDGPGSTFTWILSRIANTLMTPKVPALNGAPLLVSSGEAGGEGTTPPIFPVIVFSHGLRAMRTTYSGTVCDLASHGYLVACVEHRNGSACASLQRVPKPRGREGELQDQWIEYHNHEVPKVTEDPMGNIEAEFPYRSEQVKQRADEVRKALDLLTLLNEGGEIKNMLEGSYDFKQFKGRMDVGTAAVMGHSYGGGTTVQTLAEDPRFKCGIALDGWMIPIHSDIYSNCASISQPLYFINSYNFQWQENMRRMLSLVKPMDNNGKTSCRILTLKGTHHLNQSDTPFVFNRTLVNLLSLNESRLDSEVAHRVNMDICHAFLKRHLLKDPAYQGDVPNLDGTEGHSEHILFGTNVKMTSETKATPEGPGGESAEGEGLEEEGGADKGEGLEKEGGADKGEGWEEGGADKGEGLEEASADKLEAEQVGETPLEGEGLEGAADVV